MGQYITHRKLKPRKEAAPIVFNEDAARREREGWDIIQKVRELELIDKRARMEQRRANREASAPNEGSIAYLKTRKAVKEHMEKWDRIARKAVIPWHAYELPKRVITAGAFGLPTPKFYMALHIWSRWIFEGEYLLEEFPEHVAEKVRGLPTPVYRRGIRLMVRFYWEDVVTNGNPFELEEFKEDTKRLLRLRRRLIKYADKSFEETHMWVRRDGTVISLERP